MACTLFLASCSAGHHNLKTSKGTGFKIDNYKTFGFQDQTRQGDSLPEPFYANLDLIKSTITNNLVAKGLRKSQNPDIIIAVSGQTEEKVQTRQTDFRTDGLPRYTGQRRYSWKSQEVPIGKYEAGTLILNISDTTQEKLVWRGEIENVFPKKETKIQAQLVKALNDLLNKIR